MVTAPEKATNELTETETIIEEFKQRLSRSLLKEKTRLHELADTEAKNILATAYQEAARLSEKARQEAESVVERAKINASKETEKTLEQASSQAEQSVKIAEERIRKEAKERTKKEVDSILRKTTEDATRQAAKILQAAREEATQLSRQMLNKAENDSGELMRSAADLHKKAAEELTSAQKKSSDAVEQTMTDVRRTAQVQAEREASEIISKAKSTAQKEKDLLLAAAITEAKMTTTVEIEAMLVKAKNEAEEIINQAKNKVRTQIEESSRLMLEIHQKMQQVMAVPHGEPQKNIHPEIALKMEKQTPYQSGLAPEPTVSKIGSDISPENAPPANNAQSKIDSLFSDDATRTYSGKLKIDITPPSDNEQIAVLERQLLKNSGLRIMAKGGAEDGSAWLEIDISSLLPLVDILRKSPIVKDVVGAKSYIIVTLKSRQTG